MLIWYIYSLCCFSILSSNFFQVWYVVWYVSRSFVEVAFIIINILKFLKLQKFFKKYVFVFIPFHVHKVSFKNQFQ